MAPAGVSAMGLTTQTLELVVVLDTLMPVSTVALMTIQTAIQFGTTT